VPTLEDVLPTDRIPPNAQWIQRSGVQAWMNVNDTPENFQRRGGHPVYTAESIQYVTNSLGYRCPEFDAVADVRIISVGCSLVFGAGLADEHVFHSRLAQKIRETTGKSVVVWNLSRCGASNDYITRMLHTSVPVLNPNVVLINFTFPGRREYMSADGRLLSLFPGRPGTSLKKDAVVLELEKHYEAMASANDDAVNLYRNYKSVEALLRDRLWTFSMHPDTIHPSVESHFDPAHYAGFLMMIDTARDYIHPGPASHAAICDKHWDKLVSLGVLTKL
jgi:hypothetical protein